MATETQRDRLRLDTGHTAASLSDDEADDIYTRAAEEYSASAVNSGARILAIQYLLGSAAKLNDYTQNNSQESASQVFDHLKQMLSYWEAKAGEETRDDFGGGVLTGRTKHIPRRLKGFPGAV